MNVQNEIRRIYEVLRDLQDRVMDLESPDEPDVIELTSAIGFEAASVDDFDEDDPED